MARCMYCFHCGGCGPSSFDPKVKPAGYCIFCGTQNDAEDEVCATCGKRLPAVPGASCRIKLDEGDSAD